MKIIVFGFTHTPEAYLKDVWNQLDFFIVVTSILALPANTLLSGNCNASDDVFAKFRILRTFRALRPLRMINRAPGLKCVVDAIFKCIPAFINIGLVTFLVYLVFAIMGVQLWAGKFWSCNEDFGADYYLDYLKDENGTQYDKGYGGSNKEAWQVCIENGGVWQNKPLNFDNVLNAQLTLFEVSSLEIWLDVMYAAMDVPADINMSPHRNNAWAWALYFVVFVVIGSFLMMNLFVGAVVDNFNRIKSELDKKGAIMTEEQEAFVQSFKTMINKTPTAKPSAPSKEGALGAIRYKLYKMIRYDYTTKREVKRDATPLFDQIIMLLIALNILVMAGPIWVQPLPPDQSGIAIVPDTKADIDAQALCTQYATGSFNRDVCDYNKGLETANSVFNFLFLIEASMKLLALGVKQYFSSGMNTFDFVIVCISLVGFIINLSVEDVDPSLVSVISVIKAGRVVRIFRLAMRVKGIRKLLETLIYTAPSLFNVTCLLGIILFIYTVLGMAFFGNQTMGEGPHYMGVPPFSLYNQYANFRHFHIGFFCLFRMSTGESWNGIMHDSMEHVSPYSWIYYVSYMIVGSSLLFQLIVAVLLEQFTAAAQEEESIVTPDDIEEYATVWREFDPQTTFTIKAEDLPRFLRHMQPPLGLGPDASSQEVMKYIKESELKVAINGAHYVETFFSLVTYVYKAKYKHRWSGKIDEAVLLEMTSQLTEGFPSIGEVDYKDDYSSDAIASYAAVKIQSIERKRQAGRRVNEKALEKTGKPLSSFAGIVDGAGGAPSAGSNVEDPPTKPGAVAEGNGSAMPPLPPPSLSLGSNSPLGGSKGSSPRLEQPRASPPGLPPLDGSAAPPSLPPIPSSEASPKVPPAAPEADAPAEKSEAQ
jgi:hypothetical protein